MPFLRGLNYKYLKKVIEKSNFYSKTIETKLQKILQKYILILKLLAFYHVTLIFKYS